MCESVLTWMGAMGFYEMDRVVVRGEGAAGVRIVVAEYDRQTRHT